MRILLPYIYITANELIDKKLALPRRGGGPLSAELNY
jgi:hypothetical protein